MEHSELLDAVRRSLSPDTQIELLASRSEYENVQEILEEEGSKFPKLQYDGARKVAILSATPTPLHGEMVGPDAGTKRHLSSTHDMRNTKDTGDTSTTRNWDGALRYLTREETGPGHALMVAVEFVRSTAESELRCPSTKSAVTNGHQRNITRHSRRKGSQQNAEHVLRVQLLANPFGPLKIGEDTWFGKVATVVLETYRLEDETSPPGTLLNPTQSFTIVDDGRFVWGKVPANLAELTLVNCIPTHILSGNNIAATPINFFHQDWFEDSFGSAMLETAMERVEHKRKVQRV